MTRDDIGAALFGTVLGLLFVISLVTRWWGM
jgi:hypothetical protein